MAHELEFDANGNARMAYAGQAPWHRLGTVVPDDLTPEEFMKVAGLDWTVEKVDNFIEYNGKKIYTGTKSLVRSEDAKILCPGVGPDWEPVQNAEAFEFFNDLVEAGHMKMNTAGSLRGGQMVWALAKIEDSFTLFGGDEVRGHLLFSNPHVYGKSTIVDFVAERVVCANTLAVALNEKSQNRVVLNHRAKFDAARVKEMMGIATFKLGTFKEAAEYLGSKKFKKDNLQDYFNEVFPLTSNKNGSKEVSKNSALAMEILDTQPGANFAEGTWWQAFNTITYMGDHILSRQDDTRLYNSWFGGMRNRKIEALELAIDYADAS